MQQQQKYSKCVLFYMYIRERSLVVCVSTQVCTDHKDCIWQPCPCKPPPFTRLEMSNELTWIRNVQKFTESLNCVIWQWKWLLHFTDNFGCVSSPSYLSFSWLGLSFMGKHPGLSPTIVTLSNRLIVSLTVIKSDHITEWSGGLLE